MGHLFVVNIKFGLSKAARKEFLFNEIYSLIFEKNKLLDPSQRFVYQFTETTTRNDRGSVNTYKYNKKLMRQ